MHKIESRVLFSDQLLQIHRTKIIKGGLRCQCNSFVIEGHG